MRTLTESVDHLSSEASEIRSELSQLRAEKATENAAMRHAIKQKTTAIWVATALMFIVLICSVLAAFQVSLNNTQAIKDNNARWCPVVAPLAPRPGDPPPVGTPEQVARSIRIRIAFAKLVKDFNCDTDLTSSSNTSAPAPSPTP